MRVAIYGAGAMGTVLGAYITKAGYDIELINRNKNHVESLQKNGAVITGTTSFIQPVTAYYPNDMTGTYDIILLMTKQRHNKEITTFLKDYLKENGILCTMQNGIPEPLIASIIGNNRTAGCTMSWGATIHKDGIVELTSEPTRDTLTFQIGMHGNCNQKRFDVLVTYLKQMGNVKVEENFMGARWSKLLVNAAFSGLSMVTAATFGEIAKNKDTRILALEAIQECIEVGHANDIKIEPIQGKDVVKLMHYKTKLKKWFSYFLLPIAMRKHKTIKSSMLRDLRLGRKTEIDAINGVIQKYGIKANIPTPINDAIVDIVHQIEDGTLSPSWENVTLLQQIIKK